MATSDIRRFQETCRNFWITAAKYAISKLPLESEVLLVASCLPQVIKEEEKAELREEFMDYCTSELPPDFTLASAQDMLIDTYWHKVGQLKDDSGQLKYSLLTKLAESILIIPHGNADVERLFSHMGLNKTKLRNSLGVDTLTALLRLQFNVKEPCFHSNQHN